MSTENLCFEQKYEILEMFFCLKIFSFWKFSMYLNRRVFVMRNYFQFCHSVFIALNGIPLRIHLTFHSNCLLGKQFA